MKEKNWGGIVEDKFLIAWCNRFVLQDLQKRQLLSGQYGKYRLELPCLVNGIDSLWFFVEQTCVVPYCPDKMRPDMVRYQVFLTEPQYDVTVVTTAEEEFVWRLYRDEIADLYLFGNATQPYRLYDIMGISVTSLGICDWRYDYREVSFMSSRIRPGAYLTFFVKDIDIHWIPKQKTLFDMMFKETMELEIFVCLVLSEDKYQVRYKDAKTCWKYQTMDITKEELICDYLYGSRAAVQGLSVTEYQKVQEERRLQIGLPVNW